MVDITTGSIPPEIRTLLSFATSEKNVEAEFDLYNESSVRKLYGYTIEGHPVGCIGVEFLGPDKGEIKHIAVLPQHRGRGIGDKMVNFIKDKHSLSLIYAETDKDAVYFYEKVFNVFY
ncbi:GNAT family N-acetyltransferase [Halobacillus litoralis]|uniref:GNAT family N-acetyltransferase n=1 Tax=Halobacillus litoralis TaxID=45668 RepID=A0A410M9L7_9BACI|nr:GNAT family N-acetyltransferase [Halobacillus litoralis]